MIAVLHLVRTGLPDGVAGPDDVVVYTGDAAPPGVAPDRVWRPRADDEPCQTLSTEALCRLVFAAERVVVW